MTRAKSMTVLVAAAVQCWLGVFCVCSAQERGVDPREPLDLVSEIKTLKTGLTKYDKSYADAALQIQDLSGYGKKAIEQRRRESSHKKYGKDDVIYVWTKTGVESIIISHPQLRVDRAGQSGRIPLAAGEIGNVFAPVACQVTVLEVLNKREMRVGIDGSKQGAPNYGQYWIEGVSTDDFADGLVIHQPENTAVEIFKGTVFVVTGKANSRHLLVVDVTKAQFAVERVRELVYFRNWTDSTGDFVGFAKFVDFKDNGANLARIDGKGIEIPMSRLSKDDQEWIRDELKIRALEKSKSSGDKRKKK